MATCDEGMNLVVLGHVDHGKSTLVGRLLADTGSLPKGRLEDLRERCRAAGRGFEWAFLVDALADEQAKGITIEASRVHFHTAKRRYLILDAPGHREFLRNMVTGAARADAALLVIDAEEGVRDNSRRHAHLASLLGIRQRLVLVNKMDRVGWSQQRFEEVVASCSPLVGEALFLPLSGRTGDNLLEPSPRLPWFRGPAVLPALDSLEVPAPDLAQPFRMFVQDVYRSDGPPIVVGTLSSGSLSVGDEVILHPSGQRSRVSGFPSGGSRAEVGQAVGFTLQDELGVARGQLAARADQRPPRVARRFRTSLFWLGSAPLSPGREYRLKLGTASAQARLEEVGRHLDAATLEVRPEATEVEPGCAAECVLSVERPLAFDEQVPEAGRFVLVDGFRISGGGILREALP